MVLFATLASAWAVWLGSKATTISEEIQSATELLPQIRDDVLRNDAGEAKRHVEILKTHTARARGASSDPLWTLACAIPWLGSNFQAVAEVTTSADDVARLGATPLVHLFESLNWETLVPREGGMDLGPVAEANPKLVSAAQAVQQSSDRLNAIDETTLIPQVATPLIRAREQLAALRSGLQTAADVASVAPDMLGVDNPRHYLLIVQNSAESRATGGIPGALAVLSIENGKLTLGSHTSATELGTFTPPLAVDPEQQQIYSTRPGKYMQDVNLTPDFPSAATTAAAMWERRTGERMSGVISIDPVALAYILDATGPVQLSDPGLTQIAGNSLPEELTSKNVVPTLLSHVYAEIPSPEIQDVYFAGVAKEIFSALSSGSGDDTALIKGLARGAAERRILLWSDVPSEQAVISNYPLGGAISGSVVSPAEFGIHFNDATGAKMDYYVKRTVQLVKECASDGYEQTTVRITSTNAAPANAATSLPAYVTGDGIFGVPAGSVQTNIVTYGPAQAHVETAKLDGRNTAFAPYLHANRPVGVLAVRLAPGESKTVEFTFGKIVQHTEPNVVVTPTVQNVNDVIQPTQVAECSPAT